jgi:hypothetical protein
MSIIKNLVIDRKDAQGRPILHAQFSADTLPMDVTLKRLRKARPMTDDRGLVLHFNVGHQANAKDVNLFLLRYLLVSSWRDSHGFTFPRHEKDTIVIELCNTGKEDERERILVCKYFQVLPLESGISSISIYPQQQLKSKMFYSWGADPEAYERGSQMLIGMYNSMVRAEKTIVYQYEIAGIEIPGDEEMEGIIASIACENFCPKQHLMQKQHVPTQNLACASCKAAIEPTLQGHAQCHTCNYSLCSACMNQLPVPLCSQALFFRRYFWFAVTQLQNFFHSFEAIWNVSMIHEIEDAEMYKKITYHYCRIILFCAKNLAKPSMEPFDEKHPLDDVKRCANMSKFENWRDTPFFLVT